MECLNKNNEVVTASKAAEEKIKNIIKRFVLRTKTSYGFDANSDNGIQDMHYSTKYDDLQASNFIIDGDNVTHYKYCENVAEFDGNKEVIVHSWDDSVYGGSTDQVDKGTVEIVKKEKGETC